MYQFVTHVERSGVLVLMLSSAGLELIIYILVSVSITNGLTASYLVQQKFWPKIIKGKSDAHRDAMYFVSCPQCMGLWIGLGFWLFISIYRLGHVDIFDIISYAFINSIISKIVGDVIG